MQLLLGVDPLDPAKEREEVDRGVARTGLHGDLAGRYVERGEQAGRAVALVVVGVALDLAGSERQHRLGPVERLDLGLLVDAQHDRPLGRRQIQPDHVADLGLELGVGTEFEGLDPVWLQPGLGPDALDRRDRHADPGGDPSRAPVGRPVGGRLEGQRDDPVTIGPGVGRRTARSGRLAQAGQPISLEPAPPEQDGHEGDAELGGDPLVGHAGGGADHDPGPLGEALLGRPGSDQALQRGSFGWTDDQLGCGWMSHAMHRSCDHHNGLVTSALEH